MRDLEQTETQEDTEQQITTEQVVSEDLAQREVLKAGVRSATAELSTAVGKETSKAALRQTLEQAQTLQRANPEDLDANIRVIRTACELLRQGDHIFVAAKLGNSAVLGIKGERQIRAFEQAEIQKLSTDESEADVEKIPA